jgi:hypothetical protein
MRLAIGLLGVGFLLSACGSSSEGGLFSDPDPLDEAGTNGSGGRLGSGSGGGSASDGGAKIGSGGARPGSGGKTTGSGGADADASTGATDAGVEGGSADASLDAAGDGSSPDASPDGAVETGGASGTGGKGGGGRGNGGAKGDAGPLDEPTPGTIACGASQCVIDAVIPNACCIGFPGPSCLPTFPGCFAQLGSPTLACDDAADCEGGERCCGTVSGSGAGSECAAACEDGEPQLCRTDSECRRGTRCLPVVATPNYSTCR